MRVMKKKTFFPDSLGKIDIVADVAPFPFVPATTITGSGLS